MPNTTILTKLFRPSSTFYSLKCRLFSPNLTWISCSTLPRWSFNISNKSKMKVSLPRWQLSRKHLIINLKWWVRHLIIARRKQWGRFILKTMTKTSWTLLEIKIIQLTTWASIVLSRDSVIVAVVWVLMTDKDIYHIKTTWLLWPLLLNKHRNLTSKKTSLVYVTSKSRIHNRKQSFKVFLGMKNQIRRKTNMP